MPPPAPRLTTSPHQAATAASAYRIAIEQTTHVIGRRARSIRNLVVAVVVIGLAALVWAIAARPALGLGSLLFLIPACGVFFTADAMLLRDWRSGILSRWIERDLDLAAFRDAIAANPALPAATTRAMLATLPRTESLVAEQRVPLGVRRAAAAESRFVHGKREDTLLVNTLASTLASGALVAALWARAWTPLFALAILVLRPMIGVWSHRRRLAARDAELATCRRQPDFAEADYQRLITGLGD